MNYKIPSTKSQINSKYQIQNSPPKADPPLAEKHHLFWSFEFRI